MRPSALVPLLLALPLAASAAAQNCPVQGVSTQDFGQASGLFDPAILGLAIDPDACELDVSIEAFTCCNVFISKHFLGYGFSPLPNPQPLGPPFVSGSNLYINLAMLLGPFPGKTSSLSVPPNPGLVGLTVDFQAFPVYFTTIGFTEDFAATQAVAATFL